MPAQPEIKSARWHNVLAGHSTGRYDRMPKSKYRKKRKK